MAEPMPFFSPAKPQSISTDEDDMTWHDPPSSPFVSHIEINDQENIAPGSIAPTPVKSLVSLDEEAPQSAFKISSPSKSVGLRDRTSPVKTAPTQPQPLLGDFDLPTPSDNGIDIETPKASSPTKHTTTDRPGSALSSRSHKSYSPSKSSSHTPSADSTQRLSRSLRDNAVDFFSQPTERSSYHTESALQENEGLTVAITMTEETRHESLETSTSYSTQNTTPEAEDVGMDDTEFNADGPELSAIDFDDTCLSGFSEMPNLDMTKFAVLSKNSPTKTGLFDHATPRARGQMTPSTVRRNDRTPSPTPRGKSRKDNDTTNLLLDFTAQIEAFSSSRRQSPTRGRQSPVKSTTESNLLSYIQNQRSPAKGGSYVPSTPGQNRQHFNLLDFELPPPPTPRSVPTVTIRELESLKSTFQSQVSSLTASLSGKEAEVESLVKAIADAERRVGEAQETVRDERSAREHAEAQMIDWKKKGEEVQSLLQDVQAELARNDSERENLLSRLLELEKRTEEAESRASELETRAIEAESKNVDMTTFISPDEGEGERKIYSETECQTAIAEKVNDVARDLHAAYKAKHEKKIKALKENYQKKADERCKELRVQIIRLERQVEDAEKKRDDTFSKVVPDEFARNAPTAGSTSNADELKRLEEQKFEIESLKAKLAGLQSELTSLRQSHDTLFQELEAERVEKGELVAAAEQMLSLCGEKMEELQQEELRKSTMGGVPPSAPTPSRGRPGSALGMMRPGSAVGDRIGAMGGAEKGSGIAKPSGLRAPGGFGFGGPGLNRSTSGGKSRIMSNLERMGGGRHE